MTLSEFLSKLQNVKRAGGGQTAQCPGHEDRENSLSITEKDGKILLHCFAGCDVGSILGALNLELKDLFSISKQMGKPGAASAGSPQGKKKTAAPAKIVAEYIYCDAAGRPVAKKVRFEPKSFGWFRWESADSSPAGRDQNDSQGKWLKGLDGVRTPLYRWPEIKDWEWVLIVEGEKDADAGAALGFPATTSGGNNTWRAEHAEALLGKRVVIIADGDDTGRLAARRIAQSVWDAERTGGHRSPLQPDQDDNAGRIEPQIQLLELPGAKDLAEAVEKGWTHERLLSLFAEIEPWKPQPASDLLDAAYYFIKRFVALTEPQARSVTLWIAHAHAFQAAEATPYLSITSAEKQSGKTRLLEVLALLAPNAWMTSRVSPASLYRKIDAEQPTLLLDESDAAFKSGDEYSEVLRGVLNAGFRTGGAVTVCVGQGKDIRYHDFLCYCPKAIAGIGKLPDTITDRSLPIRLKRATRGTVERLRLRKVRPEAESIRAELAAWGAKNTAALRDRQPEMPESLTDRQADVVEPLMAITEAAGGEWAKLGRESLMTLCELGQQEDDSLSVRLLTDVREVMEGRVRAEEEGALTTRLDGEPERLVKISSIDLIKTLTGMETSPWAELMYGKPITPIKLARMLKPFEIAPRSIRFASGRITKGYWAEQFEDAFKRYLPLVNGEGEAV